MKSKGWMKTVVVAILIIVFILSYTAFFLPLGSTPQPPEPQRQAVDDDGEEPLVPDGFKGPTGPPSAAVPTEAPGN